MRIIILLLGLTYGCVSERPTLVSISVTNLGEKALGRLYIQEQPKPTPSENETIQISAMIPQPRRGITGPEGEVLVLYTRKISGESVRSNCKFTASLTNKISFGPDDAGRLFLKC